MALPCGKQFVGPPDRLDIAYRMHKKKCAICKSRTLSIRVKDVSFEKDMNKTVDIRGKSKVQNTKGTAKVASGYRKGERVDVIPFTHVDATALFGLGSMNAEPEPTEEEL